MAFYLSGLGRFNRFFFFLILFAILGGILLAYRAFPEPDRDEYEKLAEKESAQPQGYDLVTETVACQQFVKRFPESPHTVKIKKFLDDYRRRLMDLVAVKTDEIYDILDQIEQGKASEDKIRQAYSILKNAQDMYREVDPPLDLEEITNSVTLAAQRIIQKRREEERGLFVAGDYLTIRNRLQNAIDWQIEFLRPAIQDWKESQDRQFDVIYRQVMSQVKALVEKDRHDEALRLLETLQAQQHPSSELDPEIRKLKEARAEFRAKELERRRREFDQLVEKAQALKPEAIHDKIELLESALKLLDDRKSNPEMEKLYKKTRVELNALYAKYPERITEFNQRCELAKKYIEEKNWASAEQALTRASELANYAPPDQIAQEQKTVATYRELLKKRMEEAKGDIFRTPKK